MSYFAWVLKEPFLKSLFYSKKIKMNVGTPLLVFT